MFMNRIHDESREYGADLAAKTRSANVSVIIPTKNRPDDLRRTVETLLDQTVLPTELIVVDQSPGCETASALGAVFDRHARGASVRLRHLHAPEVTGGAAARNVAMSLATGDTWLFLDDDVELDARFLEELLHVYASHPDAAGVSGIITNYPTPPLAYRLWMQLFVHKPLFDDRQPVYWGWRRLASGPPLPVTRLGGGLMSFRASAIRHLRFDESLRGVSDGEDVDFCVRLGGKSLFIAPRAQLRHCQSPSGRLSDHWLRRTARGIEFLYQKNWRRQPAARVSHLWLLVGFATVATWAAVRSRSFAPWKALRAGLREGRGVVHGR
jgi:GT2 family glycosyltransferase